MTGEDHTIFAASTFFGVIVIFICLFLGLAIKKYKIYALPEAACTMIVGFFVGCLLVAFFPSHTDMFTFSPSVFFFILLPPIIFEAGYTLKRSDFFTNLGAILLYAILGTIITCIVIGVGLFIAAANDLVPLDSSSPIEAFQFGSLIAATDTVATIAILSSEELAADPLLYSLVFGESVLNDAVAIVLYKTFDSFHSVPFSWTTLFQAGLLFLGVSIGSALAGLFVALVCCFVFRKFNFSEYPVYEFTLIALFAYCSYFLAEVCNLSGIMGIFFCAVGMAHYNYYNISGNARIATHDGFKSIAQICDTFTFIYIGVTAGISVGPNSSELIYSPVLIVLTVLFMLIGRCANIFFLNLFINPNRTLRIPFRMQIVQWFAGMRGSVAFALALNFPGDNHEYVVTSTLAVVILSTLVIGASTLPMLKLTGMTQSNIQGDETVQNKRFVVKKFIAWWISFDKNYMRKWFGDPADRHLRVGNFHAHDHESGVDEHDVEHVISKLRKSSRSHSHGGGGFEEEKTAAEHH